MTETSWQCRVKTEQGSSMIFYPLKTKEHIETLLRDLQMSEIQIASIRWRELDE